VPDAPVALPPFGLGHHAVLVTGAGRGLGRAMALAVAAAGARVVAVARSERELLETVRLDHTGRTVALPWDLQDLDGMDTLVAEAAARVAAPLTAVVHAAGVHDRRPAAEVTVESWRRLLGVNLEAPFFLATAAFRAQQQWGVRGSQVLVGSLTSSRGVVDAAAYGAGKTGLLGVLRGLAVEWAAHGMRINAVAPGYFRTSMNAAGLADPLRQEWVLARIPMGRVGEPADLGGAVVFLLSDAAAYITGQVLNVDGGWTAA
jgi:2-deoxy-D-gluconate 3-dehydrogenase